MVSVIDALFMAGDSRPWGIPGRLSWQDLPVRPLSAESASLALLRSHRVR
jgi:hypothetical protein